MLSNMCCEGDKVERNEMDGAYNLRGGQMEIAYRILVEKSERKRPLWRHRRI
jgi:hypothetical protein